MAKNNGGEKAPRNSSQPITDNGKMAEAVAKAEARQDASAEQGKSAKVEIAPDDMQMVLEQLQAMRSELQSARDEIKTMRNDMQELGKRVDYLESQCDKRVARKKGVGILATIGASFRSIFSKKPEQSKADEQDEDADVQPTAKLNPIDAPAPVADTQASSGATPNQDDLEVLHKDEIHHGSKPDSDTSDSKESDNPGRSPEKHKWRRRIGMALAGIALATGIGVGVANCDAVTNYLSGSNPQEAAATATATVQNEVDDLAGVLAVDPSTLSGKQLEEQMDKLQQEKTDVAEAIEKNGNADADTLANARGILDSEDTLNYQEDLQNAIDAFNARSEAAEKLGVDIDTYAELEHAADDMHLSIERVKELADYYGVPADKLGTDEAQNYMRDNLLSPTSVSEAFNCDTPEQAAEVLIFTAYNNKGALAQYINALDEDNGSPDSGIDGLEMPVNVDNLYQRYCNDHAAYAADFARFVEAMESATVTERDATDQIMYSYYLSDGNRMVCSRGPENSGGDTTKIYEVTFYDADGNVIAVMLVKNGCGQIEAGGSTYTAVTPTIVKAPTPNQTTTTTTPTAPPTTTTTTTVAKDAQADPTYGTDQTADRVASDESAEMVGATGDGAADNGSYVGADGEKHEVGNQGDDVVVGASDGHGTAAGLESERPGDSPR